MIGTPIVLLLLSMFGKADPIFAHATKEFFGQDFLKHVPQRLFWSVILFFAFAPAAFLSLSDKITSPFGNFMKGRWNREMTVVMALVAIVVASFLVVQWPYIFARVPAETDLSKFGVPNYSEYVKRGFNELIRIAILLYGLLWAGLLLFRDKPKKERGLLPIVQVGVIVEFLIFIASVFRRIWLYQLYHGWTLIRIYGGVFLVWLTGMVLFLALRHFYKKRWVMGEVILTASIVIALSLFNAEHFIATTHPPTVNKRVDYVYLSRLSSDGYTGWKQALDHAEEVLTNPQLHTKALLDTHDRREISYAGTILLRLAIKHRSFLSWYGSKDETWQYINAVIDFERSLHPEKLAVVPEQRIKAGTGVQIIPEKTALKEEVNKQKELFDDIQKKRNELNPFDVLQGISISFPVAQYGVAVGAMQEYPISFFSVYKPYKTPPYKDPWNRMLSWNASEADAYKHMQQDMPIERLLRVQKAFIQLSQKISKQPEGEQTVESDISFDAPFLEWIY